MGEQLYDSPGAYKGRGPQRTGGSTLHAWHLNVKRLARASDPAYRQTGEFFSFFMRLVPAWEQQDGLQGSGAAGLHTSRRGPHPQAKTGECLCAEMRRRGA